MNGSHSKNVCLKESMKETQGHTELKQNKTKPQNFQTHQKYFLKNQNRDDLFLISHQEYDLHLLFAQGTPS